MAKAKALKVKIPFIGYARSLIRVKSSLCSETFRKVCRKGEKCIQVRDTIAKREYKNCKEIVVREV